MLEVETESRIITAQRSGIWYTQDLIAWLREQKPPEPPRITQYYEGYTNAIENVIMALEEATVSQ